MTLDMTAVAIAVFMLLCSAVCLGMTIGTILSERDGEDK